MLPCDKGAYRRFVEGLPNLCTRGLVTMEYCRLFKLDFEASRHELIEAFDDFVACCNWLSGCRFDDYATHFSPGTDRLLGKISACLGRPISHGSLVAAVLYLELPHVMPGTSPGLAVGVSRFCPRLHASA